MKTAIITATALLLLSSLSAHARPPRAVVEDGREVSAAMLTMPSAVNGIVAIQGCTACKRTNFTLSPDVQFYIGRQEVNLADLTRHLRANPKSSVLVVSPINQAVVTRISASVPDLK